MAEVHDRFFSAEEEEPFADTLNGFKSVADSLPLVIWLADVGGSCLWCNNTYLQVSGRTLDQETGRGWLDHVHPDDRFPVLAAYTKAVRGGREFKEAYRFRSSDGQYRWVLAHAARLPHDAAGTYVGYLFDIHEQKLGEAKIREVADLFPRVFDAVPVGMALQSESGECIQVNRALSSMLGYAPDELLHSGFQNVTHPEDRDETVAILQRFVSGQVTSDSLERRYVRKDGRVLWAHVNVAAIRDVEGSFKHFILQVRDITARKEAERRLLTQYEMTRILAECASISELTPRLLERLCDYSDSQVGVLWLVDRETAVLKIAGFWNRPGISARAFRRACFARTFPAGALLPGQAWQEAAPRWITDVTQDASFARAPFAAAAGLRGATAFPILFKDTVVGVLELFSTLACEPTPGTLELLEIAGRQVGQFVEWIQAEEALRNATVMSAMGSLIASVAHEVRNPLFGMSATLDAFEARFGRAKDLRQYATVLRSEMDRLKDLMEELLEYGKPMRLDLSSVPLAEVLEEAVRCCAPLADKLHVRLRVQLERRLPQIQIDRRRLLLVFRNVLENAIQHSARSASVTIVAKRERNEEGLWVKCKVLDRGPGFMAEDLPHICEPFFSKRRGGTGLGLAIVHRIVKEHGGVLLAQNRPSGGADVTVRIPTFPRGKASHERTSTQAAGRTGSA